MRGSETLEAEVLQANLRQDQDLLENEARRPGHRQGHVSAGPQCAGGSQDTEAQGPGEREKENREEEGEKSHTNSWTHNGLFYCLLVTILLPLHPRPHMWCLL